jgi:nucleoside-diphosphate-sugar epimerase
MNASVLVTGATGFVGSCLVRRLVVEGYDVHIVVRRDSARWRIGDLSGKMVEHHCDLRDAAAVERLTDSVRPEIICHLATYGGFASQQDNRTIVEANLLGTMNLLRACEKTGFRLFINTGSSSEYGQKQHPMREGDLPEPLGDYGVTKVAATLFCQSEAVTKGLPVVTLRLFSPYGPWDDPRRLIPFVAACLLAGESPQLASPKSVRDYVYIDDVVDCYLSLIRSRERGPAGIFNVGSGRQHTIGEVVSLLEDLAGSGVCARWGERPLARPEPEVWVADVSKVRDLLGWIPRTSLHDGLATTLTWMRDNLNFYRGGS